MGDVFEMKGGGKMGINPSIELHNEVHEDWLNMEALLAEVGDQIAAGNWAKAFKWLLLLEGHAQTMSIRLRVMEKMEEWGSKKISELRPGPEPTPAV